jgi:23S rRNA pseudouridine2605 synthase
MAPGARPIGKGRAEAEKAEVDAKKARKSAMYGKPAGRKPAGKPRSDRPAGNRDGGRDDRPRGDGPRGPGRGGSNADRRR